MSGRAREEKKGPFTTTQGPHLNGPLTQSLHSLSSFRILSGTYLTPQSSDIYPVDVKSENSIIKLIGKSNPRKWRPLRLLGLINHPGRQSSGSSPRCAALQALFIYRKPQQTGRNRRRR
ncbi:hypothetical protein RUM44_009090 [Polyplax serrata]|uniref:Uncharacterized protein n=1 Tax=Polyplax serrata TaxID=468196 RepID=A0ABR1ARP7_POLSC